MWHDIVFSPEAADDLQSLRAYDRGVIRDALEAHLRHQPAKVSRSRIKRLRGMRQPQFRLRVGEFRVFYDVAEHEVQILAIVSKPNAHAWLEQAGAPDEESGTVESEG